jgi:CheY-like chemotaxis protein
MAIVLVVEDDADLRAAVARALGRAGHSVLEAGTGQVALESVRNGTRPDLILTDLEMPERTGLDLITVTRRENRTLPIIAMSGKGRPLAVLLRLARQCGADAAIAKPFSLSDLTDLVADVLARSADRARADAETAGGTTRDAGVRGHARPPVRDD